MAKPFDATLNAMIDLDPAEWAKAFASPRIEPGDPIEVLDTDLATTLQADKLFRIGGAHPSLLHLELEANPRSGIPRDLMRYNTLIDHVHSLPVESVLILLRPKAQVSDQTGVYRRLDPRGELIAEFRYRVEKVWERSVDDWLNCGPGLAPLALLTEEANSRMESSLDRFRDSLLEHGLDDRTYRSLMSSSYVLCGLRHDSIRIESLFRRFSMLLEESTTYQAILEEGRNRGLSQGLSQGIVATLLEQGEERFGPAPEPAVAALQCIADPNRLRRLAKRLLSATSWDELLATA